MSSRQVDKQTSRRVISRRAVSRQADKLSAYKLSADKGQGTSGQAHKASLLVCLYLVTCLLTASADGGQAVKTRLSAVAPGYSRTSVNTAVFRNSPLTTAGDTQYVSFYDADGRLVLGKRRLGTDDWTLRPSAYKGNAADAHNVISMAVDGDGYLHVAFDHHNTPLSYCRSVSPGSLEPGPKEPMTGDDEQRVTYPEFYRLADGGLLFAYRSGESGRGNLVMNRYDLKTRSWSRLHDVLIDGEDRRSAYWQLCMDKAGTIHLSWVWRDTWGVETNHDMCYARSRDGGKTWEKSTGEPYALPITAATAEYACRIPQNSELINQTGMAADDEGRPYIATYWRSAGDSVPQYRIVWNDGRRWHASQVTRRTKPFTLSGGGTKMIPISRPRLIVDGGKAFMLFRDEERGSRVSMLIASLSADKSSADKGQADEGRADKQTSRQDKSPGLLVSDCSSAEMSAEIIDLTDFPVDAWEPTLDTELWTHRRKLHVFVQRTGQGDGERSVDIEPQMVNVLEVSW